MNGLSNQDIPKVEKSQLFEGFKDPGFPNLDIYKVWREGEAERERKRTEGEKTTQVCTNVDV